MADKPKHGTPQTLTFTTIFEGKPQFGSHTVSLVHSPLPADHPFYAIIGRVAAEWARLEHALDVTIWSLAGLSHKLGSCITANMIGYRPRMEALEALAALRGAETGTLKYLNKTTGIIGTLSKKRNRFVHDAWYISNKGELAQFVSFTAKEKKYGMIPISPKDGEEIAQEIAQRTDKILLLKKRLLSDIAS